MPTLYKTLLVIPLVMILGVGCNDKHVNAPSTDTPPRTLGVKIDQDAIVKPNRWSVRESTVDGKNRICIQDRGGIYFADDYLCESSEGLSEQETLELAKKMAKDIDKKREQAMALEKVQRERVERIMEQLNQDWRDEAK